MTRIIGVISGKGGVGKTTTTINLAAALTSKFNKKVTVIDCNVTTPHVGLSLGIWENSFHTLNEVLKGNRDVAEVTYSYSDGLNIVPASLSLNNLKKIKIEKLGKLIKNTLPETDIVLLDAAPGLGKEAVSAIMASDELIFVATPYLVSIADVMRTKGVAREAGKDVLGIIVNMKRKDGFELTSKEIENFAQIPVMGVVEYDPGILRALSAKKPSFFVNEKSRSSREYLKIASSLVGEYYSDGRNIFSRFVDFFGNVFGVG